MLSLMRFTTRINTLCLLAIFFAGTLANTVTATTMTADMMLQISLERDAVPANCPDCPPLEEMATKCGQICVASFAAIVPAAALEPRAIEPRVGIGSIPRAHGRTGPPDPFPPRTNAKA